jgi:hypothetical protein
MAKYLVDGIECLVEGSLPVRFLNPLDAAIAVNGTVKFNADNPIPVVYPDPSEVLETVIIGSYADGDFTRMITQQKDGGSRTVYLFYIDSGSERTYYQSLSSTGSPRTSIPATVVGNNFILLNLITQIIESQPTIVIGTIIIDLPKD